MPESEETPDSPSGSPPSPPSYKNSTLNVDDNKTKASSTPANLEQSDNDDTSSSNESPPPPTPDSKASPDSNKDDGETTPPSQNTTATPTATPSGSFSPPPSNFSNNSVPKPALMPPPSPISTMNHTSPPTGNNDKIIKQAAAGAAVAGLFIIAMVFLFFCLRRRNKKKRRQGPPYGMPPPPNFQVTTDAYIAMGNSGRNDSNFYYNSQGGQQPHSNMASSFGGSQRGESIRGPDSGLIATSKTFFGYEELMEITNGFSRKNLSVLEWSKRVKIAAGAAKGLAYLHEDCHPRIIHRDIKWQTLDLPDLTTRLKPMFQLESWAHSVDPRLEKRYVESEMFRMIEAAAACVRHSATKRPRMVAVARALDFEEDSSDLSNGVKFGQSTVYDSGQYSQEIMNFRRLALAGDNSSEFDYSGEYNSKEVAQQRGGQQNNTWNSRYSSGEFTSGELEKQAFKPNTNSDDYSTGASGNYGGGRFRYN
ncbi:hypothetical protein CCACVL1_14551 [Corchorus capsularis]|uniref:non-specific serine/threonine protein kinase n=1 Tax=Corchorus capsularis TaxID=210143 RepID=A0A1R3I6R9_COCAP|nr:hypothetical protein CCACVL1_14551 [Corchorus capsularis]